ncbi:hypothetical protein, partial [Bacteroides acidifaciens]|uniref:hypothetical protein n=1 Tax=Bacteroides acidifaciens TaxID=85831 RepID=UPI0025A985EC
MNLYSPDIIKNDFHFNVATYSINRHAHEETLSSIYDDENTHKCGTACFIKKAAIHTSIMEILDYDMPEKESAIVAFEKLKSVLPLLGIDCPFGKETFNLYCCENIPKDIETSAGQIMPILQSCFEEHPALSYLYPLFHMVMRSCYQQAGKSADAGLLQCAKLLSEEVNNFETLYTQARNYLDEVIIEPSKQGLQLPSSAIAEIYHSYCLYASKQDFQSDALSTMELKNNFLSDIRAQKDSCNTQNWTEYLNHASNLITDNAIGKYPITSFKQFL